MNPTTSAYQIFAIGDRLSFAAEKAALVDWAIWRSEDAEGCAETAFDLAVAIGLHLLFDCKSEVAGTPPLLTLNPHQASAAMVEARRAVAIETRNVRDVEFRLDQAETFVERDDILIDHLNFRLELETFQLAVVDSIQRFTDANTRIQTLAECDLLRHLIGRLDDAVSEFADTFCLVAESNWPRNLQRLLPDSSWQPRPWWLTTVLQERYESLMRESQTIDDIVDELVVRCEVVDHQAVRLEREGAKQTNQFDVSVAADNQDAVPDVVIAYSETEKGSLKLRWQVRVADEYDGVQLDDLPDDVQLTISLLVRETASMKSDENESEIEAAQTWSMRIGGFIDDIEVHRVGDSNDLRGSLQKRVFEVRKMRFDGQWRDLHLRRRF